MGSGYPDWSRFVVNTRNLNKSLAVDTFTINHTVAGSILNMFDEDILAQLELSTTTGVAKTTTIILDFGSIIKIHNTILHVNLKAESGANEARFVFEHSKDKSTWTEIADEEVISTSDKVFDVSAIDATYRYLRLKAITNSGTSTKRVRFRELVITL